MARANRAPRALAEPARRTSLGPRPRPPMARQARCPRRKGAGPGPAGPGAGGRASWAGPVPPTPQLPPPCPTSAKTGIQGTGPAQAQPVLAPKGKGHGADCPQAAGPARAPSEQLPLVPPIHGGHRGPESPTRRATEPGAHAPRATGQLPRPGLGQAEPLASRRQGPPAPTSLPCQPPRQEGTVQCSRESAERFLLMAVFHQECQPALPPPPPKSSPSVLRQGKKTNPHQEQKHTQKTPNGQCLSKPANRGLPINRATLRAPWVGCASKPSAPPCRDPSVRAPLRLPW